MLSASRHTHPRLQPIFTLQGVPRPPDEQLPLHGYRGSRPVMLGNGAAHQLQLGNFGDLLDAAWRYTRHGNALDPETGTRLSEIASLVCRIWRNDDSGIWELKGEQRPYTTSKIACWATLDRALRSPRRARSPAGPRASGGPSATGSAPSSRSAAGRGSGGAYAFYAGTSDLDASVLLAPRMGFCEATDERYLATLDAVLERARRGCARLALQRACASRRAPSSPARSGSSRRSRAAGRGEEAAERMRDLLELGGPTGLYSEEAAADGTLLGNLPQALTHLSLIDAATRSRRPGRSAAGASGRRRRSPPSARCLVRTGPPF